MTEKITGIALLQSARLRCASAAEWAHSANLLNVGAELSLAANEIKSYLMNTANQREGEG